MVSKTSEANNTKNNKKKIKNDKKVQKNKNRDVKKKKAVQTEVKYNHGGSLVSNIVKAVVYVVIVLAASAVLSYLAIVWANDVFAFRKDSSEINVTIGEYADVASISEELSSKNVIRYPGVFRLYSKVRHYDNYTYVPGEYTVSPSMPYDKLIGAFVEKPSERTEVRVTIPEGYSVDEMIDLMLSKGIGTREGWIRAINEVEYDYWFLDGLETDENRYYRLEGYLYPDTYFLYSDSKESVAITKMLDNFASKFKKKYMTRVEERGMTLDEVMILASMIEKEGKFDTEYQTISSVFHNRLESKTITKLQSEATVAYVVRHREGARREILPADTEIDDHYNTYFYEGLPAGPICNPTIGSISAALYPEESDYMYFVADVDGHSLFGVTMEEHRSNIATVEEHKEAIKKQKDD